MESFGKSKWNYKTSNFFTGFHHIAYLESIKSSYGKSRPAKQNLPKLPYLYKRITPRYSSQYLEIRQRRSHQATSASNKKIEQPNDAKGNVKHQIICDDNRIEEHPETQGDASIENNKANISEVNESKACHEENKEKNDVEGKNCSQEDTFTDVLRELEMTQTQFKNEILSCCNKAPKAQRSIETTDVSSRLLESMKSMIVQEEANSFKGSSVTWEDSKSQSEVSEIMAKFPKETKTAMMVLFNRSKEKAAAKKFEVETQTSFGTTPNKLCLPCVKNLLCTKGFHSGRCDGDSTSVSYSSNLSKNNLNFNLVENII